MINFSKYIDDDFTNENMEKIDSLNNRKNNENIEFLVNKNISDNKNKNLSGLAAIRVIDSNILMKAPKGYFDKYLENIPEMTNNIQREISDKNLSYVIKNAKENPTNEKIQEKAYQTISVMIIDEVNKFGYKQIDRYITTCLLVNELLGFSVIDPLWRDRTIDEIAIHGPKKVIVDIAGKNYHVNGCSFLNEEHLMALIEKLYKSINKTLSATTPQAKGRLHDSSRIFANHSTIAIGGPTLNIRRHREAHWTPSDIVAEGTASVEMLTEIGNLINKGCSFLVLGGTSSGKTSLLNALTGFYDNDQLIITIEDNVEMRPNPNKMLGAPLEVRQGGVDRTDRGVPMRKLVQAATQMRPNVILIGEVTDDAAYDLCQALNTGHYGASTVHANDEAAGIHRLSSLISQSGLVTGDNTLPLIATAFDFIIQTERLIDGSRKIVSVSEIGVETTLSDSGSKVLPITKLWEFQTKGFNDAGRIEGDFVKVNDLSPLRRKLKRIDILKDKTWEEFQEMSLITKKEV